MAGIIEKKVTIRDKDGHAGFIVSDRGVCIMDYLRIDFALMSRAMAVQAFGETQVMRAEDRWCQQ